MPAQRGDDDKSLCDRVVQLLLATLSIFSTAGSFGQNFRKGALAKGGCADVVNEHCTPDARNIAWWSFMSYIT